DVDERVTGEDALVEGRLDALVDRRDVLARDGAALDLVDELVAAAGAGGLEVDHHVRVLAAATGLLDVLVRDVLHRAAAGLAVRDLRAADRVVQLELAHHAGNEQLNV